jgi:hypothetical protein
MAGIVEVRSSETGISWVGGIVLIIGFCWMIFDVGVSGGFVGGWTPLDPDLTSQFSVERQSLIQAFMLAKFWLVCLLP